MINTLTKLKEYCVYAFPMPVALLVFFSLIVTILVYPTFSLMGTDAVFYTLMSDNLASGNGLVVFGEPHTIFSPLLPILMVPFMLMIEDIEFAAHVAVIFFAIATIPLLYVVAREVVEKKAAFYATLLFSLSGVWIWNYVVTISPQIIATFLSILLFGLLIRMFKYYTPAVSFGIGSVVALLYLTRPEYILFFPFLALLIMGVMRIHGKQWKVIGAKLVWYVLGFLLFVLPYLVFLHNSLGEWSISGRVNEVTLVLTTDDYEAVENANTGTAAVVTPPALDESVSTLLAQNVFPLVKKLFDGLLTVEHNLLKSFGILGFSLFAFGAWYFVKQRNYTVVLTLTALLVPVTLVALVQGGSPNYLIQYFYLFIIPMGTGLWFLQEHLFKEFKIKETVQRVLFVGFTSLVVLYFFFPVVQNMLFLPPGYNKAEMKEMGLWMAEHIEEDVTIFSRKPEIAFYANTKWAVIPNVASANELVSVMKTNDVPYVVVDDRVLRNTRPQLVHLIEGRNVPDELHHVHTVVESGYTIVLYTILDGEVGTTE